MFGTECGQVHMWEASTLNLVVMVEEGHSGKLLYVAMSTNE